LRMAWIAAEKIGFICACLYRCFNRCNCRHKI
jgi:hypothetical protein